ncbi:Transmembrane protease serine 5 [Coemansia spiralis]|uniref:Transmembrane protease serine 5 n=1 Tax=Coemansia spiralis TaxID=417178 RepID=A0A9W8G9J9_9FUNG|nr:Transmembrane protease serine 5 [Coemansia spiralis]
MQTWSLTVGLGLILPSLLAKIGASQASVPHHLSKRVVGGLEAQDGKYPFAVFVSSPAVTNNTGCAGAILTDQIVVTSAYCVYNSNQGKAVDPSAVTVGYGKADKSKQPRVTVQKIIFPSTYNSTSGVDDIALLQVNLTQAISPSVNRIPVHIGNIEPGDSLTFMGWGSVKQIGLASNNALNYANLTVGDDSTCGHVDLYQNSNGRAVCTRNKLTPGVAPCLGDYGGPLIAYDGSIPKLVGIFSTFVIQNSATGGALDYCGNNNTLAYFTHVGYYMSFLQEKTALSANVFTGNDPLPPATNGTNTEPGATSTNLSTGAIAGISVGAAVAIILICLLAYMARRNMKRGSEIRHEQQIYELGLQQLADELGGSYEPKQSSVGSIFSSSAATPLDDSGMTGVVSFGYRHLRRTVHSDMDAPFAENIPQPSEVGAELTLDTLGRTNPHTDGSARVMDYIRPRRDGKISDYYRHLLFYAEKEGEEETKSLISL